MLKGVLKGVILSLYIFLNEDCLPALQKSYSN